MGGGRSPTGTTDRQPPGGATMAEAYIVDAVRSPVGRRGGGLSPVHPADLGAHSLGALVDRTGVDPAAVEDVVFGCVDTIGGQAGDIARTCWLAAGLPEHVPGTTIDRQCGSSQQAIHFAAQAVLSGTMDVVVAGGVQQMSQIPISSAMNAAKALTLGFDGRFDAEIAPLGECRADEGPREPNWDKIRSLPVLTEGGRVTAACSSQISDASAALLIVNEQGLRDHGLTP